MPVLIEGYSVIINKAKASENQKAMDALNSVESTLHPMAICSDADLLRVGFVDLKQAQEFISALESAGLVYKKQQDGAEVAEDFMMVSQFGEMDVICSWLVVNFTKLPDNTLICLVSSEKAENPRKVAFPKGWNLEQSLLKRYHELRSQYMAENYTLVQEEPMHDIYENKETGQQARLLKLVMKEMAQEDIQ